MRSNQNVAEAGVGSAEVNWNMHRDAHFLHALKELHAELASGPSPKRAQLAGLHHRKCVRVPHLRVQPVGGVRRADLRDLLVQRLERLYDARGRAIWNLLLRLIVIPLRTNGRYLKTLMDMKHDISVHNQHESTEIMVFSISSQPIYYLTYNCYIFSNISKKE